MDINRLLSDELSYELFIRNLPTGGTVADKRVLLRNAFRVERSGMLPSYTPVRLECETELRICTEKLRDLANNIKQFDVNNKDNEYQRIYSRLIHITGRIKRIPVSGEQTEMIAEMNGHSLILLDKLTEIYSRVQVNSNIEIMGNPDETIGSLIDDPIPLLPQITNLNITNVEPVLSQETTEDQVDNLISFVSQHQPKVSFAPQPSTSQNKSDEPKSKPNSPVPLNSDPPTNFLSNIPVQSSPRPPVIETISHRPQSRKFDFEKLPMTSVASSRPVMLVENTERSINVSSWNLYFNGESGSVLEFLQRVEEYSLSRCVSKDRLFRAAPELLRGTALNWFRSENIQNWDELVEKLKAYFLPYDYEFSLNEEIRKRSQGPYEKVIVYIASMQNLFNRLTNKPSERTRVALIRRNLLPHIQNALALQNIDTVEQLTRFCRSIEETSLRAQQYCPPSTNYRSLLEPQLAYRKPSGTTQVSLISEDARTMSPIASVERANMPKPCWNCGTTGHTFRKCSAPRRKFCYKCGYSNVMVKDCPKCQGNGSSEPRRTDA